MVKSDHDDQGPAGLRIGGWLPPAATPPGTGPVTRPGAPDGSTSGSAADDAVGQLTVGPDGERLTRTRWSQSGAKGDRQPVPTHRHRRAAIIVTVAATLVAAAGVPVLFRPSLDGSPPEHELDPPPALLLAETSPPVTPRALPSAAPTESGALSSTTSSTPTAPTVTGPGGSAGPSGQPLSGSLLPGPGTPVPGPGSLEAEGLAAVRTGSASPRPLAGASGGTVVGSIGNSPTSMVRYPAVLVSAPGEYTVTFFYTSPERRRATITVNGRSTTPRFPATGDAVAGLAVRVQLTSGVNIIEYGNPRDWAPELDRILITA